MNWRVVSACAVGTSHSAIGQGCQDSCWATVETREGRPPVLALFVADGAGSAPHGGEGAELAIQAAAAFMQGALAQPEFGLSDSFAVDCVMAVRDCLYTKAAQSGLKARDFATTFLGLVSTGQSTLLMQVGDGAIVVDIGNGLEVPIAPMGGEYANSTHFVTDEDAISTLMTKAFSSPVLRAAAFTDGIQRLALQLATNTVHEPFFTPFFKVLSAATADQEDEIQEALARFLNSDAVNERTDDDKTLALAILLAQ
ncbi:PP2C family serine/threonine-protein phosphatase [Oxalobacteraceae bacterium R-40]|uniref:PP2C family serine/threonine-protein phosphatase n=1 Tax=Keguizhuia sedimenti TaxID=3064264 RepID=A0ABU1BL04_9BURK|nr:PP2C family serine/threonine-protein phosphatase [Oxalobacteraceae bacterium R-40]